MSETHMLGQFIPLIYHYNMLSDEARMAPSKRRLLTWSSQATPCWS